MTTMTSFSVPIPVDPITLNDGVFYADDPWDLEDVRDMITIGQLTPAETLAAERWLAQVAFYAQFS
jgi:hypothetical protein